MKTLIRILGATVFNLLVIGFFHLAFVNDYIIFQIAYWLLATLAIIGFFNMSREDYLKINAPGVSMSLVGAIVIAYLASTYGSTHTLFAGGVYLIYNIIYSIIWVGYVTGKQVK